MKKIILSLIAVMATMSINAQVVRVYDNGTLVDTYSNNSTNTVSVVFEEAPATPTGKAAVSASAGIEGNEVEWVQLWAKGPKWAVFNVGAKSASEYGGHYNWGKSVDKEYDDSYISSASDIQGTTNDTAKNLWGDNWQMPTKTDYDNLLANCDVRWTTQNGLDGRLYTGKGDYSSNSVFFPVAGSSSYGVVSNAWKRGFYWSSTPNGSNLAYNLDFDSEDQDVYGAICGCGRSVRAILK